MKYLFDTNAVINFLCENYDFKLLNQSDTFYLSFISVIELAAGYKNSEEKEITELFIDNCQRIDVNEDIINRTIAIRKETKLQIPDAIIAATADYVNAVFVTSDREVIKKVANCKINIYNPDEEIR
jgi:hypothetical protein